MERVKRGKGENDGKEREAGGGKKSGKLEERRKGLNKWEKCWRSRREESLLSDVNNNVCIR